MLSSLARRFRALSVVGAVVLLCGCGPQLKRIETKIDEVSGTTRNLQREQSTLAGDVSRVKGMLEAEGLTGDEERADMLSRMATIERAVNQLEARVEEQEVLLQRIYSAVDGLAKRAIEPRASTGSLEAPYGVGADQDTGVQSDAAPPTPTDTDAETDAVALEASDPPDSSAARVESDDAIAEDMARGAGGPSASAGTAVYDAAFRDFTRGSYSLARDGFQEYLSRFPETDLSDNAAYWVGETFYAQGNYREALRRFDSVLRRYPSGDILAAARLKAGHCHLELGEAERAGQRYRELVRESPDSDEAFIARHKLAELGVSP